jgi:hypothetical protein
MGDLSEEEVAEIGKAEKLIIDCMVMNGVSVSAGLTAMIRVISKSMRKKDAGIRLYRLLNGFIAENEGLLEFHDR